MRQFLSTFHFFSPEERSFFFSRKKEGKRERTMFTSLSLSLSLSDSSLLCALWGLIDSPSVFARKETSSIMCNEEEREREKIGFFFFFWVEGRLGPQKARGGKERIFLSLSSANSEAPVRRLHRDFSITKTCEKKVVFFNLSFFSRFSPKTSIFSTTSSLSLFAIYYSQTTTLTHERRLSLLFSLLFLFFRVFF